MKPEGNGRKEQDPVPESSDTDPRIRIKAIRIRITTFMFRGIVGLRTPALSLREYLPRVARVAWRRRQTWTWRVRGWPPCRGWWPSWWPQPRSDSPSARTSQRPGQHKHFLQSQNLETFKRLQSRGLQFYTFFGISIGIKRRMIAIGQKVTFYFLQNVWKCTVFFAFAFKVCNKCYYDPKNFFLENIIMGIKKAEFYADFKFVDAGFQKCS